MRVVLFYLKRLVWWGLYLGWELRQRVSFRRLRFSDFYIIDIDNTLTVSELGAPVNHRSPAPREQTVRFVQRLLEEEKAVLFLSARDFRLYDNTKDWLANQQIWTKSKGLFLVRSANAKLPYLMKAIRQNSKVIFVDDMSYNHENGTVKSYDDEISRLQELDLLYLGKDVIHANTLFAACNIAPNRPTGQA